MFTMLRARSGRAIAISWQTHAPMPTRPIKMDMAPAQMIEQSDCVVGMHARRGGNTGSIFGVADAAVIENRDRVPIGQSAGEVAFTAVAIGSPSTHAQHRVATAVNLVIQIVIVDADKRHGGHPLLVCGKTPNTSKPPTQVKFAGRIKGDGMPPQRRRPQSWQQTPAMAHCRADAGMAELVDAVDSKSTGSNPLGVRVPLPVPTRSQCWLASCRGRVQAHFDPGATLRAGFPSRRTSGTTQ